MLPQFDPKAASGRCVVLHLGNGASMCALSAGRSVASTMGFTAVDGLPMGTRCGALDPGVILYLMDQRGMDARAIEKLIYSESGLLGVSGVSSDMRTLLASDAPHARLAVDLYVYRIGRELGSLAAALGGLDAIVFTGGIGENSAEIRERVCREARWLGVELDEQANRTGGPRISLATGCGRRMGGPDQRRTDDRPPHAARAASLVTDPLNTETTAMDAIRTLLESQLLFTLFLTVALGYLVGEINIKGFSLGSGAVLFVGLAIGGFAPKSAPPRLVGTLGLLLFLYGVGIQYGAQFFKGLTSVDGLKANAAAALGVIGAGFVSLALLPLFGVKLDEALGLFAGAGTSTATLQAIIATLKGDGAAVGYGVAYPFGVAIPILCIHLLNTWLKPKFDEPSGQTFEAAEIALRNPDFIGIRFSRPALHDCLRASRSPQFGGTTRTRFPTDSLVLKADDVLLATATASEPLAAAVALFGELQPGRMTATARISVISGSSPRAVPWSGRHWETSAFPRASSVRSPMSAGAMPTCCLSPTSSWKSATGSDSLATAPKRRPSGSSSAIRFGARPNSASSRSASVPRSACCWG